MVAAAVALTAAGAVRFSVSRPVQPVVVMLEPVVPLITLAVSMFLTVVLSLSAKAAVWVIFRVSVPAPPSTESPTDQVAVGPATSTALKVSLPDVPVKPSAPEVSVIASYSAISL